MIFTTPEHPFYGRQTDEDGWAWISAGELQVCDRVRKADGSSGTVEEVVSEERPRLMYNLSVQGAETFFVGGQKWLVHNTCPLTPRGPLLWGFWSDYPKTIYQDVNMLSSGNDFIPATLLMNEWFQGDSEVEVFRHPQWRKSSGLEQGPLVHAAVSRERYIAPAQQQWSQKPTKGSL